MSSHNTYLAYKRDSRHLLYWMIWTSNAIIKTLPAAQDAQDDQPQAPNVTGQITVDGPLLAENYIWLTVRFMMIFMQLEEKLQELRNPLYVHAYETPGIQGPGKRVTLSTFALFE